MSKLVLAAEAKRDLSEIKIYVSTSLKNGAAAMRIVSSITKELHTLERFPKMGRIVDSELNAEGYRMLTCGNYLAFYRTDGDTIYVDRILYGRRDYAALLFGGETQEQDKTE